MKMRLLIAVFALAGLLGSGQSVAQDAYITNETSNNVSVIDTKTNKVTVTIPVGTGPFGVAVSPDRTKVYVANEGSNTVSVVDTATNKVTATIPGGFSPSGVAVSPDATCCALPGASSTYRVLVPLCPKVIPSKVKYRVQFDGEDANEFVVIVHAPDEAAAASIAEQTIQPSR
jgi:YVTN family beta-propeller protein